jgi:hypothetical protein
VLQHPSSIDSSSKSSILDKKKGTKPSEDESDLNFLDCEVPEEIIHTDPHGGNNFYSQVTIKGICVKLGEFVKATLETNEADKDTTAVCQVLAIFDDVEGGLGILMEARWFTRISELSDKRRKTYVYFSHVIFITGIFCFFFSLNYPFPLRTLSKILISFHPKHYLVDC